jgi:hypothetical protein
VGKVANAEVAARARAKERLAQVWAARAERDRRIEDAVTAGVSAADAKAAAARQRDLAVEAAGLAVQEAERVAAEAIAAADERVAASAAALKVEGLGVAQIAELLSSPAAEVRRMLRGTPSAAASEDSPPVGGAA